VLVTLATLATALGAAAPQTSPLGTTRTDLQRHDLSVSGWESLQAVVHFGPGVAAPRHKHPGEEIIYVLEGTLEYQLDGQAPVTLTPGAVLFVPYGVVHSARNIGTGPAAELATYVVEKGKPLIEIVK
jgi:quercetin dioxygenase-like cupin family protein